MVGRFVCRLGLVSHTNSAESSIVFLARSICSRQRQPNQSMSIAPTPSSRVTAAIGFLIHLEQFIVLLAIGLVRGQALLGGIVSLDLVQIGQVLHLGAQLCRVAG